MIAAARGLCVGCCAAALLGCGEVEGSKSTTASSDAAASVSSANSPIDVIDRAGLAKIVQQRDGKPALINFWAMWCHPCVTELPDFLAAAGELRARGGEFHTIAMDLLERGATADHVREALPRFLAERSFEMPVSIYDDDTDGLGSLGIPGILPTTIVVDGAGRIIEVHEGAASRAEFDAMVARALAPAVPGAK